MRAEPHIGSNSLKTLAIALSLIFTPLIHSCEPAIPTVVDQPQHTENADIELYVNSLPYSFGVMDSPMIAFNAVAQDMINKGELTKWTSSDVDLWNPFAFDVISKESGGCWNIKGGTLFNAVGDDCFSPSRVGKKSDSGFGQLISLWYKYPKGILCKLHGVCSQSWIISSPYSSMKAFIWALEYDGSHPWCYNKSALRYHKCSLAPDR